ncbi:MAG: hypothetical protein ACEY26_00485 [Candidatus Hodgkinia cicadicola]
MRGLVIVKTIGQSAYETINLRGVNDLTSLVWTITLNETRDWRKYIATKSLNLCKTFCELWSIKRKDESLMLTTDLREICKDELRSNWLNGICG